MANIPLIEKGQSADGWEKIDKYPLNEPYAYVEILFNHDNDTYLYSVVEPELSTGERELLKEIKERLYELIDVNLELLDNPEEYLQDIVREILQKFRIDIEKAQLDKINYYVIRDSLGYGKLDPLMRDPMIEDISGDGWDIPVYLYHRKLTSIATNIVFDRNEMDNMIYRLAQRSGRHISLASPLLDASLQTGDRLQLTLGNEVTRRGSTFTIRKFKADPITPIDLIDYGTLSARMVAFLWIAMENKKSIIVGGGTASGKTTSLNALCMFIPSDSKIVTIEDTRELHLKHENWIPSVTRAARGETNAIEMYDLLKAALRQRPEYLIVGEVRGKEATVLFQGMATGHATYSTLHANSTDAVVRRLVNPPIDIPLLLLGGLDIICIQGTVKVGDAKARRCQQLSEVTGIDFENNALLADDVFTWVPPKDSFEFSGKSRILNEIAENSGITPEEMLEELELRAMLLEHMRERKLNNYRQVRDIVTRYYQAPEETLKSHGIETEEIT